MGGPHSLGEIEVAAVVGAQQGKRCSKHGGVRKKMRKFRLSWGGGLLSIKALRRGLGAKQPPNNKQPPPLFVLATTAWARGSRKGEKAIFFALVLPHRFVCSNSAR